MEFDSNLIKLETELSEKSAILNAYFGPKYNQVFGNEFQNAWGVKNPLIEIYIIHEQDERFGELLDEDVYGTVTTLDPALGDARLGAFYFLPNPKGTVDQHRGLWHRVSPQERYFFKGMALSLLCYFVKHLIQIGRIPVDGHITVEASGGDSEEDMEKLVNFYRSIGFIPWTLDPQLLMAGYEDYHVPMMASVRELLERCTEKSKFQFQGSFQ